MIFDNDFNLFLTACVFGWVLFLYFANQLRCKRKFDLFDPFILISGLYLLIFVWAPSVWMQRGQTGYQGIEVMEYLPKGNAVFIIGYICFVLGSYSGRKKKKAFIICDNLSNSDKCIKYRCQISLYATVVFLASIALGLLYYRMQGKGFMYMLTLGQMGNEIEITKSTSFLFLSCFIRSAIPGLLMLVAFSEFNKAVLILATLATIMITVTTGSRNLTISAALAVIVYLYISNNKRPRLRTSIFAIVILYIFVGFVGIYRGVMLSGGTIDLSAISLQSLLDAFMYNVEIFFPFYNLVETVPQKAGFNYGLGFLNVFIQFIPRAIWPGKPATLGTSALSAVYGSSMGGAAYPNIGSFYYEFGVPGVIFLMYQFGYRTQKYYWRGTTSKEKFRQIQFAIMFGYLFQFVCRSSIASWGIDIAFMFGPIWIAKRYWGIKS